MTTATRTLTTNLPALRSPSPSEPLRALLHNACMHARRLWRDLRRDSHQVAVATSALWDHAEARARIALQDGMPRFGRTTREALAVIGSYRLYDLKAPLLSPEGAAAELEALHRRNGERLFASCVELGGGLLKVGQLMSARPDLLPLALVEPLQALQDRVPAEPWPVVEAALIEALGAPLAEVFATFDETPLAAASLAQVHAATLRDGTPLAVKVRRPGIAEVIDADIAALRVIAALLAEAAPGVDVATVVDEITGALRIELDFVQEAEHLRRFAAAFEGDARIVVPEVVEALSSESVLTMTRIEGARIGDWLDAAPPADRTALLSLLLDCIARQVFQHGVVHADPHPGNFLVLEGLALEGPRLAVLDFGAVSFLEPPKRRAYAELLGALLGRQVDKVAGHLAELGFSAGGGDDAALRALAADVVELFFVPGGWDLETLDPRAQIEDGRVMIQRHPQVHVPPELVAIGRVLATVGGLFLKHRPPIDLMRAVLPHIARALATPRG